MPRANSGALGGDNKDNSDLQWFYKIHCWFFAIFKGSVAWRVFFGDEVEHNGHILVPRYFQWEGGVTSGG